MKAHVEFSGLPQGVLQWDKVYGLLLSLFSFSTTEVMAEPQFEENLAEQVG